MNLKVQCFLKDADRRQHQDERVRNWIAELRAVAYDSEDLIDTFVLQRPTCEGEGECGVLINKCTSLFIQAPLLHQIRNQIQSIRTRIGYISASMQTYGIQFHAESNGEMQQRWRRSYPHNEEDHIICFDLKDQLIMEEERVRVVSIVGMGGLGKTTLAKKVYNDKHVRQLFDCHSWAFISQQFSLRDVLIGILEDVASAQDKSKLENEMASKQKMQKMKEELRYRSLLETMKEEKLVTILYDVLKEKRYLLVLDDIWKNEAWDSLKPAFPKGKKGSRVLVTTRIKYVASHADAFSTPVEPPLLNEDEGWQLLRKKAFLKDVVIEHGYEKLGREMVTRCGGLRLAIVVIGGLLANKSLNEWKAVKRSINAQFAKSDNNQHYEGVYGILALSFHNLPFHLKPCFLYLSQFPEDWPIKKRSLIRMWIAEGFIPQSTQGDGEETMEDRAEQYLEELVSRCMIQVSQRDHTGSGIKICRMHDLVRDTCISKAKEENFLGVVEHHEYAAARGTFSSTVTNQSRRVAIHPLITTGHDQSYPKYCVPLLKRGDSQLRSVFYFVEMNRYKMKRQQVISVFKNFRLLRVLNIENVQLDCGYLPREVGNLIHLRYLGLREVLFHRKKSCYQTSVLPDSISKLRWLYTLDLRHCGIYRKRGRSITVTYVIKVPDVVWKLECLRHFLASWYTGGLHRLDSLRNLETLKLVGAEQLIRRDAVMQMTNLRNLAVRFETKEEVEVVLKSPSFALGRLRSFEKEMPYRVSIPNLEALAGCQDLTKVALRCSLSSQSLEFLPPSLIKLTLGYSRLEKDPMVILEKLPNLRFLFLGEKSYKGSEIVCSANGFRKLEFLQLESLFELGEWRIEEGAMPCLKSLVLDELKQLRMIPEGLKFVSSLQELKMFSMGKGFEERVKGIGGVKGEDFDKVKHILSISSTRSMDDQFHRFL